MNRLGKRFRFSRGGLPVVLAWLVITGTVIAQENRKTVDFQSRIAPIFKQHCYSCHSGSQVESGFRLDRKKRAIEGGDQGIAIVPKSPANSPLIHRITTDGDERMPPEGKPLSKLQITEIKQWIAQGAHWPDGVDPQTSDQTTHWSWRPLANPALPSIQHDGWANNAIDYFIAAKLETKNISPSPRAPRSTLIRRVFLDLIGLPPSPSQLNHWKNNPAPHWYSQLIENLLNSPHYGERWGRIWLDQARYADSDGYEKDRPRPNAYLYRDWVINALNSNLPFDEFSIQQLAGDLLPNATAATRLATGFHRNTLTNHEGGIDREEDRVKQTIDRTNTTFTVWMGLTVGCAQCHSHKYDPISQREYFELYSFFNDADEASTKLDPTEIQKLEFERAKAQHQLKLNQTQNRFEAQKQKLQSQMGGLITELNKRFPTGTPEPTVDGLIAYYPLDGEPQQITHELQARRSATFQGPGRLTSAPGKDSPQDESTAETAATGSVFLDGSGQHLELANVSGFKSNQAFTCSAWIKPDSPAGGILTKMDEPNAFRGIDFTHYQGALEVHLVDQWPINAIKITPKNTRLKTGQWQHVLFSYDGSKKAAGVNIYIDGKKTESKVFHDTLKGDFSTPDPWRIGRRKVSSFYKGSIDDVRIYQRVLTDAEIQILAGDHQNLRQILKITSKPKKDRTEQEHSELLRYFIAADLKASALKKELLNLKGTPPKIKTHTAMTLAQRSSPRTTHVHIRGEFLNPGPRVTIGTPEFLPSLQTLNSQRPNRLDLAQWIFDPRNTLPPRVFVNRVWQHYFGRPLVESENDFGSQGNSPTHPELLDYLAYNFSRDGWDLKQLHRLIINSSTYQQSSQKRNKLLEVDPNNRLLAYQNRLRVSAETVRDLGLACSGLLDARVHGPSVYPPLPPGVIELAFIDVINRGPWEVSAGGDRYRRGIYTFFQRTSPYPMLSLFDSPDSNITCTRRETSNTPLQALAIWNDPVFVECAAELANRLLRSTATTNEERLRLAFQICFSRQPQAEELDVLLNLLKDSKSVFKKQTQLAAKAARRIQSPDGISNHEFGGWFLVARTLINLDEFIVRP
ncbi:MAG: DUF1553 domain-containing protein [Planctomycetota bacterium]|nr:DUF1553 domain-containing protein [Planctomycetota bacterium]